MFTVDQIVAHLVGDFLLQNYWMAKYKTKKFWVACVHATIYTLPFLFITQNPFTLFIIMSTHAIEDHTYLVKHWIGFKNKYGSCYKLHGEKMVEQIDEDTGSVEGTPDWVAYSMLWIQDNIVHLLINGAAIYWIG